MQEIYIYLVSQIVIVAVELCKNNSKNLLGKILMTSLETLKKPHKSLKETKVFGRRLVTLSYEKWLLITFNPFKTMRFVVMQYFLMFYLFLNFRINNELLLFPCHSTCRF